MDQSPIAPNLRAAHVLRHNERFDELFELVFSGDPQLQLQALAEVDEITRARPDLVVPHRKRVVAEMATFEGAEANRFVAQILTRIKLEPKERAKAAVVLETYLESPSAATVLAALAVLVDYANEDGRFRRGLLPRIERRKRDWAPALRTRAQKILDRLPQH